jgi:hypothetical protein
MFLRYHEAMLSNSFQVRQGGKISQGRAETMLANDYGISVAAVKKLQPTHQRLTEQLGGLDLEIARLLTQEKSNAAVDRRKLFVAAEARRRQAILGAREGLYRSIGSGEARSLDRFIEQDFRITVKVRQLK